MKILERLQKVIAHSGITSRRKAEQLIVDGKVKVNNKLVTKLGTKVSKDDLVEVNGVVLEKEKYVYYLLHKPTEVISSVHDDQQRKIVTDFLHGVKERVYPIGRLDYLTSGVLLLTNDGEFANLLMHPRYEFEKVYLAKVNGIPSEDDLRQLKAGVKSNDDILKAIKYKVKSIHKQTKTTTLEITLHEGKNRHVRRMLSEIGFPVTKLKRERFGFFNLQNLEPGSYRSLTTQEINRAKSIAIKNVEK